MPAAGTQPYKTVLEEMKMLVRFKQDIILNLILGRSFRSMSAKDINHRD
jgi:hypothetical protein